MLYILSKEEAETIIGSLYGSLDQVCATYIDGEDFPCEEPTCVGCFWKEERDKIIEILKHFGEEL